MPLTRWLVWSFPTSKGDAQSAKNAQERLKYCGRSTKVIGNLFRQRAPGECPTALRDINRVSPWGSAEQGFRIIVSV